MVFQNVCSNTQPNNSCCIYYPKLLKYFPFGLMQEQFNPQFRIMVSTGLYKLGSIRLSEYFIRCKYLFILLAYDIPG